MCGHFLLDHDAVKWSAAEICIIQLKDRSLKGHSGVGCKIPRLTVIRNPSPEWELRAEKSSSVRSEAGSGCDGQQSWNKLCGAGAASLELPRVLICVQDLCGLVLIKWERVTSESDHDFLY